MSETSQDKLQRKQVSPHRIITHFLSFKKIRKIVQLPWVYLNPLNTHLIGLEVIRNKKKYCRVYTHCNITHLLCPILIKNIFQRVWTADRSQTAHLLSFKRVGDIRQWEWFYPQRLNTHLFCLKVTGTTIIQRGILSCKSIFFWYL